MISKGLDQIDLRILNLLQADASITQKTLAEKAHVSPATALRRLEKLRSLGVIEKEVAILNPAYSRNRLQAVVEVTLERQDQASHDAFEAHVIETSEVQQCYRVGAGPDFILMIGVESMDAYQRLASDLFSAKYNVRNLRTFFVTKRGKFTTAQPLMTTE